MQSKARTPVTVVADLNREYALRSTTRPLDNRAPLMARGTQALHSTTYCQNLPCRRLLGYITRRHCGHRRAKQKGQFTPSRQVGVN